MNALRVLASAVLLVVLVGPGGLARAAVETAPASSNDPVAIVSLRGQIDDYSRNDFFRRFERARSAGARVVIVSIDSPGGLVTPSMEISRFLKRQDGIHTVAFVTDKAYSGASLVALACQEIWMAPSSVIGDCAPIIFNTEGQLQPLPTAERAKQESPILAEFYDSAKRNGYSPLVAAAMVDVGRSVYLLQNQAGQFKAVDEAEYAKVKGTEGWADAPGFRVPIDGPTSLLTVNPDEANALGLSRGTVSSAQALAAKLGGHVVADLTPGLGEALVEFLNNPFVRMILLTIFLQSLYIALHAPGHGAAEAVAVVSLAALVGVPLLTGYAQWWEVAVIFIGLGLCAFEIFVFPGHLVSLVVGSIMVVAGLVLTFAGKEPGGMPGWLPSLQQTWHGIQNGLMAVVGGIFTTILLSLWVRRFLPSIPYFNKLILTATTGNTTQRKPSPSQDAWPFVGSIGVAVTDLKPGGSVEFPYADASQAAPVVSSSGFVPAGTKVAVEQVQGNFVRVRAIV